MLKRILMLIEAFSILLSLTCLKILPTQFLLIRQSC